MTKDFYWKDHVLGTVKLMLRGAASRPIVKVRWVFFAQIADYWTDSVSQLYCNHFSRTLSWIAWIMDLLLTFNSSLIFCTQKLFVSDICKLRFHLLVLAKDCGPIESPSNGSSFGNLTVYPHEVSFACDEGFILNGSSIRRCTAEGTWSGTPALCEGIKSRATLP